MESRSQYRSILAFYVEKVYSGCQVECNVIDLAIVFARALLQTAQVLTKYKWPRYLPRYAYVNARIVDAFLRRLWFFRG